MNKWYELHIKNEILFWFLIVSVVPIVLLFSVNYALQKNRFKAQAKDHFELILNEKISKIEHQINDFEEEIELISTVPTVIDDFQNSESSFYKNNEVLNDTKLNEMLSMFLNKNKFYDIFFINLNGDIIYTLKKESDLGTNLFKGIYKDTNLASAFKNAKMFLETKISEFEYYQPSSDHAAFIAHPIYADNRIIGVIAAQLSQERLFEIFNDQRGLGKSGELFASYKNKQNKVISVTPLKYIKDSVKNEYQFPYNEYISSVKAANGLHGVEESRDYRGVDVISAWGYIPSLGWGIIAKIDSDEVLEPIHTVEFYSMIIIFFVVLSIITAIVMATKHIVAPIDKLTQKVKKFSTGALDTDTSCEMDIIVHNEIGVLTKNFNEMAANLKISQEVIKKYANELEEKVRQRTMELQKAKDELMDANMSMKTYLSIIDKYVIVSSTDLSGTITDASSAFCAITGYTKEELVGKKHNIVRHPNMLASTYKEIWDTLGDNRTWIGEIQNMKKDGSSYWVYSTISPVFDNKGKKTGYTSIRQDITYQKMVEELSITDKLTGLYNRFKIESVFTEEINRYKRYNEVFSVIIADIDNFKSINDTHGHDIGDITLVDLAKILKLKSRATDIVGRWGGEEFLLVLPQTDIDDAVILAENLRREIESFDFYKIKHCTASFGVSSFTDNDSIQSLVKRADTALYDAKKSGKNKVCKNISSL